MCVRACKRWIQFGPAIKVLTSGGRSRRKDPATKFFSEGPRTHFFIAVFRSSPSAHFISGPIKIFVQTVIKFMINGGQAKLCVIPPARFIALACLLRNKGIDNLVHDLGRLWCPTDSVCPAKSDSPKRKINDRGSVQEASTLR